ncbi:unnamed protein product (macronuclear) [Paramecium tetraurelia]|uniref:Transmembrane protein n=1 Tax=Paramecium tetraurelia TaxID=5888 RepID=A0BGL5_PARTE|nr:uncharacterized protein GSPATT00028717001 [Paramecium tetraurelia]CAK57682.1 unnamed protein product [Paramecium tetraurelia]|eukprot:XP_001425080.1 hypothetical protein (macronuclear) [Paramecium tetraurelia strain d4-2]
MKYERFAESFVNFIRRFLFHSAFVLVIPLLFINAVELQHHKYLKDHNYSKIIRQIDQLPNEQRESITAYLNNEFSIQYKILFLIPLLFIIKEFQEIYDKEFDDTQKTQLATSNNVPPPPILQPKVISEYVPEKSEEVLRIESYYRNQNQYDQIKNSEEVKNSNSNIKLNQSDLLNKLQFVIHSVILDYRYQSIATNNQPEPGIQVEILIRIMILLNLNPPELKPLKTFHLHSIHKILKIKLIIKSVVKYIQS